MADTPLTEHRRTTSPPVRWGTQAEFTARYEEYLDAVYGVNPADPPNGGRNQLAVEIGLAIKVRGARRVLDCAAGTGFPALDLAAAPPVEGFEIHCTDSDLPMLKILDDRVREHYGPSHGLALEKLAPRLDANKERSGLDRFLLDWAELDQVQSTYDYVMCRGNSLVYASTWSGGKKVASLEKAMALLAMIAAKVRKGGFLHIDAPRSLTDSCNQYTHNTSADGETTVWESVKAEAEYREWQVRLKSSSGVAKFQRFSTLMDIDDVSRALKTLGFTETQDVHLKHERPGFGVIIAMKN